MKKVEKLFENLYLIDGYDLDMKERTGTYVLTERDLTIVDTSASPSVPHIIDGIEKLGFSPKDIKYIVVTHIHLDHAGGAGLLLQQCPDAKVIVHPKGKRHLADPSRLIAGAKAVYGDKFNRLFDPIIPIPEEKLLAMNNEDILTISEDCSLTFYDTPGHANHHFSIYHPKLNGMFTGDTAGIRYTALLKDQIEFYLPSTTPSNFDPVKMKQSISFYRSKNLDYIFFGHYGMSRNPEEVYRQVSNWLNPFIEVAKEAFEKGKSFDEMIHLTKEGIFNIISRHLDEFNIPRDHEIYDILTLDIEVCSMGLIDYVYKENK
ncbi:MBL fold metallo-hydrolase [Robertmurraya massiliosenegalensis]|uniref:MBL fold metallo-hydrolase n=1 Tax=Robertmurraya TaxID=2837507 RepID=UPI0039A49620